MKAVRALLCACAVGALSPSASALLLGDMADAIKKTAKEEADKTVKAVKKRAEEMKKSAIDLGKNLIKKALSAARQAAEKVMASVRSTINKYKEQLLAAKDKVTQALMEKYEALKAQAEKIREKGKDFADAVTMKLQDLQDQIVERAKDLTAKANFDKAKATVFGLFERHKKTLLGYKDPATQELMQRYEAAKAEAEELAAKGEGSFDKALSNLDDLEAKVLARTRAIAQRAVTSPNEVANQALEQAKSGPPAEAAKSVATAAEGAAAEAVSSKKDFRETIPPEVTKGWEFTNADVRRIAKPLRALLSKLEDKVYRIQGEHLAFLQRLFLAARIKLAAAEAGARQNPQLAGELLAAAKSQAATVVERLRESSVE
jgi:molybdenum-dependent DNA-binding transcriptional regulator ModE